MHHNEQHLISQANHDAVQRLVTRAGLDLNWGADRGRECICAFCDSLILQSQFHFYALDDLVYKIWYCSQVCLAAHRIKA